MKFLWSWRKRTAAFSAAWLRASNGKSRPKSLRQRHHPRSGYPAIADAAEFDERDINTNFDYDCEAYGEVKRNLGRLIDLGELRLAMELLQELMKQGSYQVEMSDEGLMTEDIEECLGVVLQALKKRDLLPDEVVAWCAGMSKSDRVGCICDRELETLRKHFEALRSQ